MSTITKQQLVCINTIISKRNIAKEDKEVMVLGFTANRASSSKDLTFDEATAMIKHLKENDPHKDSIEKMKGKMMYYAREMGWTKTNAKNKQVCDVKRIDDWCLKFGSIKRKLDSYTFDELTKVLTQFQFVYKDYLKRI
jgi:hypothetical protein